MPRLLLALSALLDVLLPAACPACGALAGPPPDRLCPACAPAGPGLPRWVPALPPIALAFCLGPHSGPLGALVRRGKYGRDPTALRALGARMAAAARHRLPRVAAVVPVPVPVGRRLRRGFNQAELLARPVARAVGAPLAPALRRVGRGRQAARTGAARRTSLAGAFRSRRPVVGPVLLVDDVLTTGSTAAACATELLGAGATRVYLLTATAAARPLPPAAPAARREPDAIPSAAFHARPPPPPPRTSSHPASREAALPPRGTTGRPHPDPTQYY